MILPGVTFLEKEGTFVNSDRRIQRVRQVIPPLSAARRDGDITNAIARQMGVNLGFDDGPNTPVDPAKVMREIATLGPKWGGVTYQRLDQERFLQWPCYDSSDPGTSIVHRDGNFLRGKALLSPTPWQEAGEIPDEQYPLMLTTGRMLFHYNVGTMTRRTDLTKLQAGQRETLRIHPKDARRYAINDGDRVTVVSRRGKVTVSAEITKATNPGVLFMTFHFPESRTNILTGDAVDEFTGCPEYKVVAVQLEKTADAKS